MISKTKKISFIIHAIFTLIILFSTLIHAPHDHRFHNNCNNHSPIEHCEQCFVFHSNTQPPAVPVVTPVSYFKSDIPIEIKDQIISSVFIVINIIRAPPSLFC